jgi:CO/xanthine dehydrogenase Mo-binding subunit
VVIDGMIYAKALRSAYPRAIVKHIDISQALKHPDTVKILLASDVPENKIGHIELDWDVLIPEGGTTRYIGDALALVASSRLESLQDIVELIEVEYEVLEPVTTTKQAMQSDASNA